MCKEDESGFVKIPNFPLVKLNRPVQGSGYADVKETGTDDGKGSAKSISIEQECEEDGKGESSRRSSGKTESVGSRPLLVKVSGGEDDSGGGRKAYACPCQESQGEEERLEAVREESLRFSFL